MCNDAIMRGGCNQGILFARSLNSQYDMFHFDSWIKVGERKRTRDGHVNLRRLN